MHNIGIHNVNLRLKMLYGEESGLTITNTVPNVTVSEIIIEKNKLDKVLPVDTSQKVQEN
jgi:sensor histidine kinase YesM